MNNQIQCEFYENVYKSTSKVQIQSYFNEYADAVSNLISNTKQSVRSHMNIDIDDEQFQILTDYCSIDKLTVPGEMEKRTTRRVTWRKEVFDSEQVPDDVNLQTIIHAKNRVKLKKELKKYKYRGETPIHYEKLNRGRVRCTPGKDILVYIRVYSPYKKSNISRVASNSAKIHLDNVIAMRGEQTLSDLRDKIICLSDYAVLKNVSENPFEDTETVSAKDVYPSGFFYIEGTFYNDSRNESCLDNSELIRRWGVEHKHGPFDVARMEETRVNSLEVRFGYPWVYQHQGRCEHVIVFSDARLFDYDDELSFSVYPRITRTRFQWVRYCMTCGTHSASWITTENDRLPHNPCYFCDRCFKSFNYIDGKKIGNFKAYRYPRDKKTCQLINDEKVQKNKPKK